MCPKARLWARLLGTGKHVVLTSLLTAITAAAMFSPLSSDLEEVLYNGKNRTQPHPSDLTGYFFLGSLRDQAMAIKSS